MKIIVCKDYDEMSKEAGKIVARQIQEKPDSVLGLATGSTPIGLYQYLIQAYEAGEIDFSKITTFNLDEYIGLSEENDQSYHYFMNENLFSKVNLPKEAIHFPAVEGELFGRGYDRAIEKAGGIDLQVLGIGRDGHLAFVEPGEKLNVFTGKSDLLPETIEDNARFFESRDQVPTQAVSMGMGSIMRAKKLLILANGKAKRDAVSQIIKGEKVTTLCPVTFALMHPDATLIVDEEAAGGSSSCPLA